MNLSKSIIIIDKSVLGVSGRCCLQAPGGLSETLQGICGCEECPRAWFGPWWLCGSVWEGGGWGDTGSGAMFVFESEAPRG